MPSPLERLPIYPFLPRVEAALDAGSLVLSAETGAGKTTAVPAWLAGSGFLAGGKALVLEPRRLAAVSAAVWTAGLLGEKPGRRVGWRVKGDSCAGPAALVEFVTDAVFIRMVQDDPLLSGVRVVILDEFHERSVNADLALAFAAEAAEARGGLSILPMSASMDGGAAAAFLGCPAMAVPGRLYPVDLAYRPAPESDRAADLAEAAARAALEALEALAGTGGDRGDALVFLPGRREIEATREALLARRVDADLVCLHGSMPLAEQRAALAPEPGSRRRVILATSVAETSLTVPRVGAVVDSGLSRLSRYHAGSGLNRLVTERVSLAEAEQRRGRAGRLGPGLCYRLWDKSDILRPSRGPELERVELSSLALECALRGVSSPDGLRWLDRPSDRAWESAAGSLFSLGLVDGRGAVTDTGRRAAALGADPREAAAVIAAADSPDGRDVHCAAFAVALLEDRGFQPGSADFASALESAARSRSAPSAEQEARRLVRRALAGKGRRGTEAFDPGAAAAAAPRAGDILAPGFADRLARRLPDDSWEFPSGRRARAQAVEPRVEWLVALDVDAGDPLGFIRAAAAVSAEAAARALDRGARTSLEVDWRGTAAAAWERRRAGVFALSEKRLPRVPGEALQAAFGQRLEKEGLDWLPWDDESRAFVDRARYAARMGALGEGGESDWTTDALRSRLAAEGGPYLQSSGPVLDEAGLQSLLRSLLGNGLSALERAAPATVTTPGGRRRRPVYPPAGPARLAMRIQEAFGMDRSPLVCGRPLVLELLSPADRPLQVTDDLASFWSSAYPAIRAELSRRYPRHHWPADPLSAEPGRGPRPRS